MTDITGGICQVGGSLSSYAIVWPASYLPTIPRKLNSELHSNMAHFANITAYAIHIRDNNPGTTSNSHTKEKRRG